MFETIVKHLLDNLVEILTVWVIGIGGLVLHKVQAFFKARLSETQYNTMVKIARDIYEYVEREYGEKLQKTGEEKLKIAIEKFNEQMQKHGLPYTADDFVLQVEKIIKQESQNFGA